MWLRMSRTPFVYALLYLPDKKSGQIHEYFYRTHLQCNQSEPLADASGKIVDMNENGLWYVV